MGFRKGTGMLQIIDVQGLKEDFVREQRGHIPPEFMNYADLWESSAKHFVDLFLSYLESRGLEIRFQQFS